MLPSFHSPLFLIILIFISSSEHVTANKSNDPFKIICYFTSWSTQRGGNSAFDVSSISSSPCTHIVYSFAILNPKTLTIQMLDAKLDLILYKNITALKSKGLKVSLALGGWADSGDGKKYSNMVNNGTARTHFVTNTLQFLKKHNFDGLDLDWEYPKCWQDNCNLGPRSDRNNFANLVHELSVVFKSRGLFLSIAVSADNPTASQAYDIRRIGHDANWIGLMSYDHHLKNYTKTGHHSPLKGPPPNTIDSSEFWLKNGLSREKLVVGIPLYGRSFTLKDESFHGVGAPAVIGHPAAFTDESGYIGYFEFCSGWKYKSIEDLGSYAYKGDQWVSYNDVALIKKKADYAKNNGFGGMMAWALDLDDFDGSFCGQGKYPLMNGIKHSSTI